MIGFSDRTNLIGVTLPSPIVENLNRQYSEKKQSQTLELFVETSDPTKTETVAYEIEKLGFKTDYLQKNLQNIENKFV